MPHGIAHQVGTLPPVSSLFAALLGVNPLQHLLSAVHALSSLPAAAQQILIGKEFFPSLLLAPFHHGLVVVFCRGDRTVDPCRARLGAARRPRLMTRSAQGAAGGSWLPMR